MIDSSLNLFTDFRLIRDLVLNFLLSFSLPVIFLIQCRSFDLRRIWQYFFNLALQLRSVIRFPFLPRVTLPMVAYPELFRLSPFRASQKLIINELTILDI